MRAILVAPHGTMAMADHVHAAGAFAAFDLTIGEEVEVEWHLPGAIDAAHSQIKIQ